MLIRETIILDVTEKAIARAIDWADIFAEGHNIAAPIRRRVDIVLDDALMNVVSHGFDNPTGQNIQVAFNLEETKLSIVIADYGRAFDPTAERANENKLEGENLNIEDVEIGGLGVGLIRQMTDQMNYKRVDGQNILTLSFMLTPDGGKE
jgi:anti-sigma regulatory factor (Ser/Thr protein kinase)